MKNEENQYKFSIIEPFLNKKKKLKEIEKETNISYATLKRWVSQYKDKGLSGLNKKSRSDKNKSKKIDNQTMQLLNKLYEENYCLSLTKLYEKAKTNFLNYNNMISYSTFFRIIQNLDENIKNKSIPTIKKNKVFDYGIIQKPVVIPFFDNQNKIFYLTIFYNKENLKIINFLFEEKKRELCELFDFIRQSIIINCEYPKYISFDYKIMGISKNIFKKLYFTSKIYMEEEELTKETLGFIHYLDVDILKEFNTKKPKNIDEIKRFIEKYFFIDFSKKNRLFLDKYRTELNIFLIKRNRKVYSYGIRLKNKIYNAKFLNRYENKVVNIFYGEIYTEKILVYFQDKFLGEANQKL